MKRTLGHRHNTLGDRSGSVIVLVAIMLVAILGMAALAIDIGRMMVAKQRAQMVCDAAVLAGAQYLTGEQSSTAVNAGSGLPASGDGSAAKAAKYVALANNEAAADWVTKTVGGAPGITISFPPYPATTGTVQADNGTSVTVKLGEAIRAQAVVTVPMTFGSVLNLASANISAEATAIVGVQAQTPTPVTVTASALPWAIADSTIWNADSNPPTPRIQMGTRVSLKIYSSGDPEGFIGNGNFLAVAIGNDNGGNDYRDRIANTTPITFHLDQEIEIATEAGNMVGPTSQGLQTRLGSDIYPYPSADSTAYDSWLNSYNPSTGKRADTNRMGIIPIIQDPGGNLNGRSDLSLTGFAGVFIEGLETVTEGNKSYDRLVARFVGGIYTADGITWIDPGTTPPFSTTVTSVRLIK